MKKGASIVLALVCLLGGQVLGAQEVDRDEFAGILETVINFVNYAGPHQKIDSVAQIRAIGDLLATGIRKDRSGRNGQPARYQVLHILGEVGEAGRPADIIIFGKNAGVDHIDNVRRIISAYLGRAYGYQARDADLIAFYVTVYNAVYRGNMEYLATRYKASVLKELNADKAGLAINWQEWAGKTQIIIPLGVAVATTTQDNQLSSVAAAELLGPQVRETVRDTPGDNVGPRQEMAQLVDRTVEQEQNAIDKEKEQLARDRQAASATAGLSPGPGVTPAKASSPAPVTSPGPNPNASPSGTFGPGPTATPGPGASASPGPSAGPSNNTQLDRKEAELAARQTENQNLKEAGQTLRQETATDLAKDSQSSVSAIDQLFLKSSLKDGLIHSTLQKVNTATDALVKEAVGIDILNRQIQKFGSFLLVLTADAEGAKLVLLDATTLEIVKTGTTVLSPYSQVVILPAGSECLAVIREQGEWYLCRFDQNLNPLARSSLAVDPVGVLAVDGTRVLIQRKDGRPANLDVKELGVAR